MDNSDYNVNDYYIEVYPVFRTEWFSNEKDVINFSNEMFDEYDVKDFLIPDIKKLKADFALEGTLMPEKFNKREYYISLKRFK